MKLMGYIVVAVVFSSLLLQPLSEFIHLCKEKITLNAALINSSRAAQVNALNIYRMRDLGYDDPAATSGEFVLSVEFINFFVGAFSTSLSLTAQTPTGNTAKFDANGRFDEITVEFTFDDTTYDALSDDYYTTADTEHDRPVTFITAEMKTPYVFRTYWLDLANSVLPDKYKLTSTHRFLVQIIN